MILIWLISILLVGGILAAISARWSPQAPRWISLIAIGVDLLLGLKIWAGPASNPALSATGRWLDEVKCNCRLLAFTSTWPSTASVY